MRTHSDFHQRRFTRAINHLKRKSKSDKQKTVGGAHKESFVIEPLESRLLLSATAIAGLPTWLEQGPGSLVDGGSAVPQDNAVSGALQSIAVNPNDATQIIAGTVNGGVWRSTNADPNNPSSIKWTPLSDQMPSLAIGAVAFDTSDATGKTFYAGTGLWSDGFDSGGTAVGLYKTTDAGATWSILGNDSTGTNLLAGNRIKSIAVSNDGQTILVGTIGGTGLGYALRPGDGSREYNGLGAGGLFRSTDGGSTWSAANPGTSGAVTAVKFDPNSPQRVFASVVGQGVFRSEDSGATWNAFSTGLTGATTGTDLELAVQNVGGVTTLFAGVSTGGTLNGVFSASNLTGGGNWSALAGALPGINPGSGFAEKFQLVADPTNAGVVYLDGEGGTGVFRYNPGGSSWVQIDGGGAQGTGPHADSRDMVFLNNSTLLEGDDGGIFVLRNPITAATSNWSSFNGNLRTLEFGSVAYDSVNNIVIGGAQDNSVGQQSAANSQTWTTILSGDGNTEAVDSTSLGGDVFRYSLNNNLQGSGFLSGGLQRFRFSNADVEVTPVGTAGLVTSATNAGPIVITSSNHGLLNGDQVFIGGVQGNTAANAATSVAITVVDANHFSLNGTVGNGTYLGGGSWQRAGVITSASGTAGNAVVITTNNNHRLSSGDEVNIQGLGGSYAGLNNSMYYVTVVDATHYSLNGTNSDGTNAGGGFYNITHGVMLKTAIGAAANSGLNASDQAFNNFLPIPYVLNSVDPRMMLLGFSGIYEDADTNAANGFAGDVITNISTNLTGLNGTATALAYGGQRGGTGYTSVAFVGTNTGGLWFRGETGTAFTNISASIGTGQPIESIALNPQDWRKVYVVANNKVFFTNDVTNLAVNPFQVIGGSASDNLASLSTQLRSVTVIGDTPVVGGLGGVFRKIGANWSEYGQGLPNAVVKDLEYNAADDVLLAGTYGRGAWTISNASTTVAVPGVLQIDGDTDFAGEDDTIRLVIDGKNASMLDVFINNALTQWQFSTLTQINVNGLGGNDTLIVDSTNGLINVANGIRYDGGTGIANALQLVQTGGPQRTSDTYAIGLTNGSGTSTIVGNPTAGTQTVFFDNLSPVLDTVSSSSLQVMGTAADNSITYGPGSSSSNGLVTVDEHESVEFSNKGILTITGGAGQDRIALGSASTPTGLTKIVIDGGTGTADALDLTGTGAAVSVNTNPIASISGALGTVAMQFLNIDNLNLASGIGDLTITSTGADDVVTVTPGSAGGGGNSGSVSSSGTIPQITFVNRGTFTANLGAGNDSLTVVGTSNPDTIAINENTSTVQIIGRNGIIYSGIEQLSIIGSGGSDTFNVTTGGVAVFVDGGDPIGALPGDALNILAGGGSVTFNAGPHTDEGSFVVGTNATVSFDNIESFGISGSGPAVINETNGPDTITVIARDASTHSGADGVQDFTVSVNTGPDLLFVDVANLTINALSGSDQVTLRTPAPNNAAWNVNVTVNGGPPAGDTDRLIVETPGSLSETATYTPTSADAGLLTLTASTGQIANIAITTTEQLTYDGQGDDDVLKIVGTVGDDAIVLTPGANDQTGGLQVNSLLPMSFQNLGGSGSVGVDGGLGADTFTYNGTAANDAFTVNGAGAIGDAGQVSLNTRVIVNTIGVETLTLEGLAGDDLFTLAPSISTSVYQTLNFNGGAQASSTGDRANLIGTVGNDAFAISGQLVSLGGRTVQSSGIEDIRLNALGGTDEITYNALSNVTENITISASSIAGSGQLIVQGVALYDFQGVESFAANGNAGPNGADTLTFSGTTANDLFQIHMAATATTTDPILQLQNSTGTSTLLTLRSYTGFNTLNVLGLDGEDTFNVYVAGTNALGAAPSRNLFIDGGAPTGKKKSTDNLNLIYTTPRPSIISSAATQNPQSGLIDVNYGAARFLVQYADIEQVVIRKA